MDSREATVAFQSWVNELVLLPTLNQNLSIFGSQCFFNTTQFDISESFAGAKYDFFDGLWGFGSADGDISGDLFGVAELVLLE